MIFLILMILMFELDKIPLMVIAGITGPLGLIGAILSLFLTRQPHGIRIHCRYAGLIRHGCPEQHHPS